MYKVELDDPKGGDDRVIYVTSWGTSPWKVYAKNFKTEAEATKALKQALMRYKTFIPSGRIIPEQEGGQDGNNPDQSR
jgi:hypothetical protein